ncbi:Ubiquitin-conjugating enzyme E2 6 [Kappamyces sp. JEL0680]|nr:Ubiquitin-conjugating enzyme E2 6 [Kappamyces sp. JEL0680]
MASKQAHKRLTKEYLSIQKTPPEYIEAKPKESNILEWHYVISGPPDSPFAGGKYWGKILFPPDYPFKPPGIKMLTPNGRFRTDYRLCLSMSDYHPGTWNPAWSVATILTGLLSFMVTLCHLTVQLEDTDTTGSIRTSTLDKKLYAAQSDAWNRSQPAFSGASHRLLTLVESIYSGGPAGSPAIQQEKSEGSAVDIQDPGVSPGAGAEGAETKKKRRPRGNKEGAGSGAVSRE